VIHNLLQNAQDAVAGPNEARVPHILVEVAAAPQGARLTISDNGPGFAQKIIARAFEPYATTKPRGTGLDWRSSRRSSTSTTAASNLPTRRRAARWSASPSTPHLRSRPRKRPRRRRKSRHNKTKDATRWRTYW